MFHGIVLRMYSSQQALLQQSRDLVKGRARKSLAVPRYTRKTIPTYGSTLDGSADLSPERLPA